MFVVQQYCQIVGVTDTLNKEKLAISRLEKDALIWWQGFLVNGTDFRGSIGNQLQHLRRGRSGGVIHGSSRVL